MRTTISRFSEQNRAANQGLLDQVTAIAETKGASSGQIALAWFLAQQPWIVPIPGTRHTSRIKENVGLTAVVLSADEHAAVSALAASVGVAGAGYSGHHLGLVDG